MAKQTSPEREGC